MARTPAGWARSRRFPGTATEEIEELVELACRPVLAELAARGRPFTGVLFAGLMLTADGPRVLEYNCRFGDPETQSLLPLVDGDLLAALAACAAGDLGGVRLGRIDAAAVTVVLAAGNYPAGGDRGSRIDGIEAAEATGAHRLPGRHGAPRRRRRHERRPDPQRHRRRRRSRRGRGAAYAAADLITWEGVRRREDVALAASLSGRTHARGT